MAQEEQEPIDAELFGRLTEDWNAFQPRQSLIRFFNSTYAEAMMTAIARNCVDRVWEVFDESFWESGLRPSQCAFIFADGEIVLRDWRRPHTVNIQPADDVGPHAGDWTIQFEEAVGWRRLDKDEMAEGPGGS